MRLFPELATVAVLAAVVLLGQDSAPTPVQEVECNTECPAGTRVASFAQQTLNEGLRDGWFVYFEGECEAVCAPIEECLPPNVPQVTVEGFSCRGAPGLSDFLRDAEVDLSFGRLWDAERVRVSP